MGEMVGGRISKLASAWISRAQAGRRQSRYQGLGGPHPGGKKFSSVSVFQAHGACGGGLRRCELLLGCWGAPSRQCGDLSDVLWKCQPDHTTHEMVRGFPWEGKYLSTDYISGIGMRKVD